MAPQYAMDLIDQRAGDIDELLIARRQRQTEVGRHRKSIGPEVALPIARPLGKARHQLDGLLNAIVRHCVPFMWTVCAPCRCSAWEARVRTRAPPARSSRLAITPIRPWGPSGLWTPGRIVVLTSY